MHPDRTAIFVDRAAAGRTLAAALVAYRDRPEVIVLGLPRGGVPVAFETASALRAPLDVFMVRKVGVPGHEELAMGAIASGGAQVRNEVVVQELGISAEQFAQAAAREQVELARREARYRDGRPAPPLHGRTVILIDDGLATGSTMRAAVLAVRQEQPARIVVAVPVAPADTCAALRMVADEVVCLRTPAEFIAVGFWYDDFSQTTDEEVRDLLARTVWNLTPRR